MILSWDVYPGGHTSYIKGYFYNGAQSTSAQVISAASQSLSTSDAFKGIQSNKFYSNYF